jgi:oxygen-dependent protoporphyrinogen oxidase
MPKTIAVVGGGIAGLAAAYELRKQQLNGADVVFTLIETSKRLGGIVETHRGAGFTIECGPDGWVTDKPWARDLASELGLTDELIESNDHARVTWILQNGQLAAVPDGMRMMVPENLDAVMHSPLFSPAARAAYATEPRRAAELQQSAPDHDESVASFVERHFGEEVLRVIGAPLLGGVFGGDVHKLSVQAVMQPFVQMEREHGSLILALQARAAQRSSKPRAGIFTTLRSGTATLVDCIAATLPAACVQMQRLITGMQRTDAGWLLHSAHGQSEGYDHVLLAAPVKQARALLQSTDAEAARLMDLPSSSAVIAGFGFDAEDAPALPKGFGFLAPESEGCKLLAATFADQKFAHRAPPGGKSLRAYFGGASADELMSHPDETIAAIAMDELAKVLGPLPAAAVTVVRRWPAALPQYHVGHNRRMARLQMRIDAIGRLHLLGNGYRGVGLPDLIRDAREAARQAIAS